MTDTIAGQMEKQLERVEDVLPLKGTYYSVTWRRSKYASVEEGTHTEYCIYVGYLPESFFSGETFESAFAKLEAYLEALGQNAYHICLQALCDTNICLTP